MTVIVLIELLYKYQIKGYIYDIFFFLPSSVRGDIINPPSNRSISQSLRRERERLLKNKEHSNTLLNHKTSLHNASTGSTSFTNNSSHHFSQANQTRVDHIEEESDITYSVDQCRNNM